MYHKCGTCGTLFKCGTLNLFTIVNQMPPTTYVPQNLKDVSQIWHMWHTFQMWHTFPIRYSKSYAYNNLCATICATNVAHVAHILNVAHFSYSL